MTHPLTLGLLEHREDRLEAARAAVRYEQDARLSLEEALECFLAADPDGAAPTGDYDGPNASPTRGVTADGGSDGTLGGPDGR